MLLVTPYPKDANAFHRSTGPWAYFAKHARATDGIEFEFDVAGEDLGHKGIAWDSVGRYDLVFLHRPCREDDLTILKVARLMNIPVWAEFDDFLFEVPGWNPSAGIYGNMALQNVVAMCTACADVVSVTTSALYDRLSRVNPNVVIIPNSYRSDLYPYRKKPEKRKPELAWRGTNTHDADCLSVADGWVSLPGKVNFYGGPPWLLTSRMPNESFRIVGAQDPFLYMRQLYFDAPRVMLVPLVDCFFNRCKSNIAYQEAVHAGALCVAPDMPEWKRPGVINYNAGNDLSFAAAALKAFEMPEEERAQLADHAYDEMLKMYDAPVVNVIREATLRAVLASNFERNKKDPWDQLCGVWSMGMLKNGHAKQEKAG